MEIKQKEYRNATWEVVCARVSVEVQFGSFIDRNWIEAEKIESNNKCVRREVPWLDIVRKDGYTRVIYA